MFCHCYYGRPAHGIEHAPDMAREVSFEHEISEDYLLKRNDMRINEATCYDEGFYQVRRCKKPISRYSLCHCRDLFTCAFKATLLNRVAYPTDRGPCI